jgi:hypothetical protein
MRAGRCRIALQALDAAFAHPLSKKQMMRLHVQVLLEALADFVDQEIKLQGWEQGKFLECCADIERMIALAQPGRGLGN